MSNENNQFPSNTQNPQSANIPVESLAPFARMCCSIGMIPSSYKASMSYEEQLMWLCNYLENTVIPTVNNNTAVTNEMQDLYNQLHDYVEHYFDNLDVQQEINNKLDEMAEDGSLISVIAPYLQPFIDEQNQRITNEFNAQNEQIDIIDNLVRSSTNINPLVASSTAGMTDTSRIYVNTSDGYWYYYDGTQWSQGGIYQSTGIADNSITPAKTTFATSYTISEVTEIIPLSYTLSEQGYYCDINTGNIVSTQYTTQYKHTSNIPINHMDTFNAKGIQTLVYFTANNEYISSQTFTDDEVVNGVNLTIPLTASYFIGNLTRIFWDGTRPNGVNRIVTTIITGINIDNLKLKIENYNNLLDNNILKFSDKKLLCLGDSITGSYISGDRSYTEHLKNIALFNQVYNCGFGGCMMSPHPSPIYAPFCFCNLADAISTGDFSSQEAQIGQSPDMPNFATNLALLETVDFSNLDFLTVFYGTNDYLGGVPYDNENNKYDKTTFAGALRYGLDKIMTAYPNINIVLIEPIYRWFSENSDSDNRTGGSLQIELPKYIDIIDDVAKEFKIPVVKTYYDLGFNKYNKLVYFYGNDGTHPNPLGMTRIAEKIADTFNNNF